MTVTLPSVIKVSPNPITLEPTTGNTADVDVLTTLLWVVAYKPDWITVYPDNGTGSVPVTITADINTTGEERKDMVRFMTANGDKAKLNVIQIGYTTPPATIDEVGVFINGVTWATCNVGAPNTFAANPQDAGMFYQWNHPTAFSTTDPMTNSSEWVDMASSATEWELANNVCPSGWRIPTKAEFETLIDAGGEWVTVPAKGYRFGSGENTVFFPAAGERFYDATLVEGSTDGLWGGYWSSELRSASQPYFLQFDNSVAWISYFNGREDYCIRCVKD